MKMADTTIPTGWEKLTIKELGNGLSGTVQTGPFGAQLHAEDYLEEGVPLLLIRNLKDGRLDLTGMPKVGEKDAARLTKYSLKLGDIVFSRVGRVGSCFLADSGHTGWLISGQLLRIRIGNASIDQRYLYRALTSRYAQDHIGGESVGTTRTSINTKILESLELLVPTSKPEQAKIAEILSMVDQAIEQTETLIAKQQRINTGLMQDLLTRGVDERGILRNEDTHAFKSSFLGRIPDEWNAMPITAVTQGGAGNGLFKKPESVGSGYKLINVSEIYQPFGIDTDLENVERVAALPDDLNKYGVAEGDLFFTRSSLVLEGIAHCNIIRKVKEPTLFECHVMRIRPKKDKIVPEFLALYCRSHAARRFLMSRAKYVTMTTISQPELEALYVPVPTRRDEQLAIVNAVLSTDSSVRQTQAQLHKLIRLKAALMQDLLTGNKRVTTLL